MAEDGNFDTMSKPLWSIPIGDLSFDGPRLPGPQFLWGLAAGALIVAVIWWW